MGYIKMHKKLFSALFIVALFAVAGLILGKTLNPSGLTGAMVNIKSQRNIEPIKIQVKIQPIAKMSDNHFLFTFPNSAWLGNAGYKFRYTGNSEHIIGSIYDRNGRFIKNVCEVISGDISDVYCWWNDESTMWANGINTMDGFYKYKFFEDTTGAPVYGDLSQIEPALPQFQVIGESDLFELDMVDLLNP
jgi:hypothetical protein